LAPLVSWEPAFRGAGVFGRSWSVTQLRPFLSGNRVSGVFCGDSRGVLEGTLGRGAAETPLLADPRCIFLKFLSFGPGIFPVLAKSMGLSSFWEVPPVSGESRLSFNDSSCLESIHHLLTWFFFPYVRGYPILDCYGRSGAGRDGELPCVSPFLFPVYAWDGEVCRHPLERGGKFFLLFRPVVPPHTPTSLALTGPVQRGLGARFWRGSPQRPQLVFLPVFGCKRRRPPPCRFIRFVSLSGPAHPVPFSVFILRPPPN